MLPEQLREPCVLLKPKSRHVLADTFKLFSQVLSFCFNQKHFQHHITLDQRAMETPRLQHLSFFNASLPVGWSQDLNHVTFKEDPRDRETNPSFLICLFKLVQCRVRGDLLFILQSHTETAKTDVGLASIETDLLLDTTNVSPVSV